MMKKIFTLLSGLCLFLFVNAQQTELKAIVPVPAQKLSGYTAPNGSCDTLNIFNANTWDAFYYLYRGGGSVLGVSNLRLPDRTTVLQTANFYDVSTAGYNYVSGGLVYFAFANSSDPSRLALDVIFRLYDDAGGLPGNLIDSAVLTLDQIHSDVVAHRLTEFKFAAPVLLPASKKFYISVDTHNFFWRSSAAKDTIAIVATGDDVTQNMAYSYMKSKTFAPKWVPVDTFFRNKEKSLDVTLFVFPYVTTTPDACSVLPVSIFNFGGTIQNYQAYLNWSTAMESNNKGFYVERSKDARNFTSIGFIAGAGNSSQVKHYSFIDANLKDINVSTTYYRLKQVDLDGKATYSKVLALSLEAIASKLKLYPNPAQDGATIEVGLDVASKVQVRIITNNGKIVQAVDKGTLNAGLQQIYLNTNGLSKGSYVVQVMVGNKNYSQIMVKQ
jgi:hypothetical protein